MLEKSTTCGTKVIQFAKASALLYSSILAAAMWVKQLQFANTQSDKLLSYLVHLLSFALVLVCELYMHSCARVSAHLWANEGTSGDISYLPNLLPQTGSLTETITRLGASVPQHWGYPLSHRFIPCFCNFFLYSRL